MNDTLIFGRNAVMELLKSGRSINKIFLAEGKRDGSMQKIFSQVKASGIIFEIVTRDRLDKLCCGRHQGVAALASSVNYSTLEDILQFAAKKKRTSLFALA